MKRKVDLRSFIFFFRRAFGAVAVVQVLVRKSGGRFTAQEHIFEMQCALTNEAITTKVSKSGQTLCLSSDVGGIIDEPLGCLAPHPGDKGPVTLCRVSDGALGATRHSVAKKQDLATGANLEDKSHKTYDWSRRPRRRGANVQGAFKKDDGRSQQEHNWR
eukprot:6346707-Amphidinium_carterae.4